MQVTHLEVEMTKLSSDQFVSCRPNLNRLFEECVANLECRDRPIRVVYSLQTLCGLIRAVFRKQVRDIHLGININLPIVLVGFCKKGGYGSSADDNSDAITANNISARINNCR